MTHTILMPGRIGVQELLIVLLIVMIIFGPKQLPKLAKTFGEAMNSFKKGMTEDQEEKTEKTEKAEESQETIRDTAAQEPKE